VGPPCRIRPSGATAIWLHHCRSEAVLAVALPLSAFCSSSRSCIVAPGVSVQPLLARLYRSEVLPPAFANVVNSSLLGSASSVAYHRFEVMFGRADQVSVDGSNALVRVS